MSEHEDMANTDEGMGCLWCGRFHDPASRPPLRAPEAPDTLTPSIELVLGLIVGSTIGLVLGVLLCWLWR